LVFFNPNFINFVVFPDSCPNKNLSYIKKITRNSANRDVSQPKECMAHKAMGEHDVEKATAIMLGIFKVNTR